MLIGSYRDRISLWQKLSFCMEICREGLFDRGKLKTKLIVLIGVPILLYTVLAVADWRDQTIKC